MSKILSIVALSGNASAAIANAADDLANDLTHVIIAGNARNLIETDAAIVTSLDAAKAIKGAGKKPAVDRATAVLLALRASVEAGKAARAAFVREFPEHKGAASAPMRARAGAMAQAIASEFELVISQFEASVALAKAEKAAAAAEKREAAKQAKADRDDATKDNAPAPVIMQDEADTIELSGAIADALQAAIAVAGEAVVLQALLAFVPMKKAA